MQKQIALVTGLIFLLSVFAACQSKPSPPASATCDLGGGKTIKTDYSSPRMKGRKIYGDLVPFGKVWRTGANEATTFVTSGDVVVGGKSVPAGSYTIFTVPNADKWTLIINKETGQFHLNYNSALDFGRTKMNLKHLDAPVETFRVDLRSEGGNKGTLALVWENTEASIPFLVLP